MTAAQIQNALVGHGGADRCPIVCPRALVPPDVLPLASVKARAFRFAVRWQH